MNSEEISEVVRNLISKNFRSIAKEIDKDKNGKPGKLAYLSLSSKPESIFRDEIGWMLQKELQKIDKKYVVVREYDRYDLAVLELSEKESEKKEKLHHLIELKVQIAGVFRDKLKGAKEYVERVKRDLNKPVRKGVKDARITSLFITYGADKKITNNMYAFVKYPGRHNGLVKKGFDNPKINEVVKSRIEELLNNSNSEYTVNSIGIAKFKPFKGIGMSIYAYLIVQKK